MPDRADGLTLNDSEIQRLAGAVAALRPDWPAASLRTFIAKNLGDRAYGDAAVAFAWIATRTQTETPRLILEAGPWWRATVEGAPTVRHPPKRGEECRVHPGEFADRCRICRAPRTADEGSRPERAPVRLSVAATEAMAAMRATVAETRHGSASAEPEPEPDAPADTQPEGETA